MTHHVEFAAAVHAQERRLARGALTAHHRDVGVLRGRMHDHVGDDDFLGVGAEQRGDLLIDRVDGACALRAALGLVTEVEGVDRGGLRIGGEQHTVRPKRHGADRGHLRSRGRSRDRHAGGGPMAGDRAEGEQSERGQDLHAHSESLLQ